MIATNFTEGDGSRTETMRLLDTASGLCNMNVRGEFDSKRAYTPMRSYAQPLMRVVYEELCLKKESDEDNWEPPLAMSTYLRWTCGQFA